MAKSSREVRLFLRAAAARLAEAEQSRQSGFTLAAVYLAGYAVECHLKALLLSATPEHQQRAMRDQFRGTRGHDFTWLREQYRMSGGGEVPNAVATTFYTLDDWGTDLRYSPTTVYDGDADRFLAAAQLVIDWAKRRT